MLREDTHDLGESHCDALEVFAVTDPDLSQPGHFLGWAKCADETLSAPPGPPAAREVIAEGADVDAEIASALRNKKMPVPPDAWLRRAR